MSNIKIGLTIEEAAECTGIGRNTMRKLVDWGKLPVLKVGRKAIIRSAYSARTAHPFQRNGAPFRFKLSKAQQVD